MKLHYFHGRSPLHSLVLWQGKRRLELHIKKVSGGIWSVLVLAGGPDGQPDVTRCRGPTLIVRKPKRRCDSLPAICWSRVQSQP